MEHLRHARQIGISPHSWTYTPFPACAGHALDLIMKLPTYFISHGGGPWPYIPDMQASNATLAASLADIPKQIGAKPKAILMVSAHWETPGTFMVMSTPKPPMVYDYYGFPAHTYEIQYPAPGAPALADRVQQLLQTAGLPIVQDSQRGFDHGAFVPAYELGRAHV